MKYSVTAWLYVKNNNIIIVLIIKYDVFYKYIIPELSGISIPREKVTICDPHSKSRNTAIFYFELFQALS